MTLLAAGRESIVSIDPGRGIGGGPDVAKQPAEPIESFWFRSCTVGIVSGELAEGVWMCFSLCHYGAGPGVPVFSCLGL